MSPQKGRNAGVTGIVDFPGVGSGVFFRARVYGYKDSLTTTNKPRAGRGTTGKFRKVRALLSGGQVVVSGKVNTEGYPLPSEWKGQEGSLRLTYASGKYKTVSVRCTQATFDFNSAKDDEVNVALTLDIIASPTLTGFGGTQATPTEPTASDQEQWAGTGKVHDPKGLQSSAQRRIDVWGNLANTDAAEAQRIADVMAAHVTSPMTGQKLRTASFVRDSDDGGEVVLTYGLTDTEEDVVNPATATTTDTFGHGNSAQGAAVNGTPATPTGQVLRTETTRELNDGKILTTRVYGNRTTRDDIEFSGTVTKDDLSDLGDTAVVTKVNQSSTPPATPPFPFAGECYLVEVETTQLDRSPGNWKHVFTFSNISNAQRVTFPQDFINRDPSDLESLDSQATIGDSSDPGDDPDTRIAGLVLRSRVSKRVSGKPERWLHVRVFGPRTTEQDITFPGTFTDNDVSELEDSAVITLVTDSETRPDAPDAPVGQFVHARSIQLTDAGKWQHVFYYANTTNKQKIEFAGSVVTVDDKGLVDKETQTYVTTNASTSWPASTPTGLFKRVHDSKRIGGEPEQWQHTFEYGRRSTEDDVEMGGTVYEADQSDLEGSARVVVVETDGTPDLGVSVSGLILRQIVRKQIHATKWEMTYVFAERTSEQDVTFPNTWTIDDPGDLVESAKITIVNSVSTHAFDATTAGGTLKLRTSKSTQRTDSGKYVHEAEYGRRSTTDDVQMGDTEYVADESNLRSSAEVAVVEDDDDPDGVGAPTGLILRDTKKKQLHDGKWEIVYRFAELSSEQEVTFPATFTFTDPNALVTRSQVTIVNTTSTQSPAATISAGGSTLKLRGYKTTQLTDAAGTSAKYKHETEYGLRSTEDDVEMDGSLALDDISNLEDRIELCVVETDSTPDGVTAPTGTILRGYKKKQLHDGKWAITYVHGETTTQQDVEFPGSFTLDDPSNLLDSAKRTVVNDASTNSFASTLVVAGVTLKLRDSRSVQLTDSGKYRHEADYGLRSSEDDVEMGGSVETVDEHDLRSSAEITVVEADDSPDGNVTVSGQVLRETRRKQLHDGKWAITYVFGETTTEQDVTFPGTFTVTDPKNLLTAARVTIVDAVSTHTFDDPSGGLKLRSYKSTQLTDAGLYKHEAEYGLRSSEDDVEMAKTESAVDPESLLSKASVAAVNDTPGSPAVGANWVAVETVTSKLHDNATLKVTNYALRSSKQGVEMDGTSFTRDVSGLASEGRQVGVYDDTSDTDASITAPVVPDASVQKVSTEIQRINPLKKKVTYRYGIDTEEQKVEQRHTFRFDDGHYIKSEANAANLDSPPSAPSTAPTGGSWISRGTRVIPVTHNSNVYVTEYGTRSTLQDVELPQRFKSIDPSDLRSVAKYAEVFDKDSTEPTAPNYSTDGLQVVASRVEQFNSELKVKFVDYEKDSTKQKVEQQNSFAVRDDNALGSSARAAKVDAQPATLTGNGLVKRHQRTEQVTHDHVMFVDEYGVRTTIDDVEMPNTFSRLDPKALESLRRETKVTATGSTPTNPVTTDGLKVVARTVTKLTDDLSETRFDLATNNTADQKINPHSWTETDAGTFKLDSRAERSTVTGEAAIVAPTNTELLARATRVTKLTDAKDQTTTEYATRTSEQERTFPKTSTTQEASNIEDEAVRAKMYLTADTPPTAPDDVPSNNVKVLAYTDVPVSNLASMRVWVYGPRTAADKLTLSNTDLLDDPNELVSTAIRCAFSEGAIVSPGASFVERWTKTVPVTTGLGVDTTLYVRYYGLRDTVEDVEMGGTALGSDADALEPTGQRTIVFNTVDGDPDDFTPLPTDAQILSIVTQELTRDKSKAVARIGPRTPKQEIEWLKSFTNKEDGQLERRELISEVTTSATPAVPSSPDADLEHYQTTSHRQTATQWVHAHEYRPLNSTNELDARHAMLTVDTGDFNTEDEEIKTVIDADSAFSGTIPSPTNSDLQCDGHWTRRVGQAKYLHVFHFAYRTKDHALEAKLTTSTVDPNGLASEAVTAEHWNATGMEPTTPSSPTPGLKLVTYEDRLTANPDFKLRVYRWSLTDTVDRVVNQHNWTETDPSLLKDRAERAALNGTPTNDTGLQVRSSREVVIDDNNTATINAYGRNTTAQDVTFDEGWATADPFGEAERREASIVVVADTLTAAAHADALLSSNKSDPLFRLARSKKLTPTEMLQVIEKAGGDKVWTPQGGLSELRAYRAKPDGGFGVASCLMLVVAPGVATAPASGFTSGVAIPVHQRRNVSRFTLRRVYVTDDPWSKQYLAVRGTVNSDVFHGHDPHEVMFEAANVKYSGAVTGAHLTIVDYEFLTDTMYHVNDGFIPLGLVYVRSLSTLVNATGFYPHTVFVDTFGLGWPTASSFSGFLT